MLLAMGNHGLSQENIDVTLENRYTPSSFWGIWEKVFFLVGSAHSGRGCSVLTPFCDAEASFAKWCANVLPWEAKRSKVTPDIEVGFEGESTYRKSG